MGHPHPFLFTLISIVISWLKCIWYAVANYKIYSTRNNRLAMHNAQGTHSIQSIALPKIASIFLTLDTKEIEIIGFY